MLTSEASAPPLGECQRQLDAEMPQSAAPPLGSVPPAASAAAIASEAVAAVALASICGANNTSIQPMPPTTAALPDIRAAVEAAPASVSPLSASATRIRLPSIGDIIGGSVAAAAAAAIPPPPSVAVVGAGAAPVAPVSAAAPVTMPVLPGVGADGQRLVFAPIHPGTVGRVQSACTHHRQIKKRCPDDCAHKQRELAQSELDRVMAGETRPVAVVVPLEKLRAESARKRELTLHKRRLKKVAKVAAMNHEASSPAISSSGAIQVPQLAPQFAIAALQQVQQAGAELPQLLPPAAVLAASFGSSDESQWGRASVGGFPELFKAAALASGATADDEAMGVTKQQPKRRRRRITVDLGDVSSIEDRDQVSDEEFRL